MRVSLEELGVIRDYLRKLESVGLSDIEWCREGVVVAISDEILDEWKFTGLNNRDFGYTLLDTTDD